MRVRVTRLPAVGCPIHGEAGACPAECRMGDAIPSAKAPPGYRLAGGQWVREVPR